MVNLIQEKLVEFQRLCARLKIVNYRKENPHIQNISGDMVGLSLFDDTESMASTYTGTFITSSTSTTRTGRTSKQRRKMARKRAGGKDPAFEDEFLRTCITEIYNWSNSFQIEIRELIHTFVFTGDLTSAMEVQISFENFLAFITGAIAETFRIVDVFVPLPSDDQEISKVRPVVVEIPKMITDYKWRFEMV